MPFAAAHESGDPKRKYCRDRDSDDRVELRNRVGFAASRTQRVVSSKPYHALFTLLRLTVGAALPDFSTTTPREVE
jgi:hypothetical protein